MTPSERIAQIASLQYTNAQDEKRHSATDVYMPGGSNSADPRAIIDYLDEQYEQAEQRFPMPPGVPEPADVLSYTFEHEQGDPDPQPGVCRPTPEQQILARVAAEIRSIAEFGEEPPPSADLARWVRDLECILHGDVVPRSPLAIPRGLHAVDTDGRIELWFTGEVFPPREHYEDLSKLDVVFPEGGIHRWEDVERWRFKP